MKDSAASATSASVDPTDDGIEINEIFLSIQGESTHAGRPCVFVRTTGCPLRCSWCDTEYAFYEGERMSLDAVLHQVCRHGVPLVEITGGEPLVQPAVPELARRLQARGLEVLVETSGAYDISVLPDGVARIMDLKCPGSGEAGRNDLDNIGHLRAGDEIKFVIADRADYDWARRQIVQHRLTDRVPVLMSPVHGSVDAADLAKWILADGEDVRLQLQLHKLLWPGVERGI